MTSRKSIEAEDESVPDPEDELPYRDHLEWLALLLGIIEALSRIL
ncbi:hypothetical protein [Halobacterium salinarum]|nr:hypothetical protein [Halobacterium salinarum]